MLATHFWELTQTDDEEDAIVYLFQIPVPPRRAWYVRQRQKDKNKNAHLGWMVDGVHYYDPLPRWDAQV